MAMDDVAPACVGDVPGAFYKCEGELTYDAEPYAAEIRGDYEPVWMCEKHRYESYMDT